MSSLEDLFGKIALTTVTTVSRIALSHATNAAIKNVTSYITTQLPKNKPDTREIRTLQRQLDLKIKNLKPTIDMIARSVADGNQDLEPALEMCNDLKSDIDDFAKQVETIKEPEQVKLHLKRLLANIDDAIPSLHLSLRSIENKMGVSNISSAKLIKASHILTDQSDMTFSIKLYSLFTANATTNRFTWKEEFHKAELQVKNMTKFDYALSIIEDTDDGLYHEEGEERQKLDIHIGNIRRMYYTQSGELLNIEDSKSPVLVLKVSKNKKPEDDNNKIEIKETTPEIIKEELQEMDWFAIGLWSNNNDESDDDDDDDDDGDASDGDASDGNEAKKESTKNTKVISGNNFTYTANLLLLENVIKLALLEITEQMNHTNASDELINLYMK